MKILNDKVLVKCDPKEAQIGHIIIPNKSQKRQVWGTVELLGNGLLLKDGRRRSFDVKVGERVCFDKFMGQELKIEGFEYVLISESEILAVLG